jgi:hypothetical protein
MVISEAMKPWREQIDLLDGCNEHWRIEYWVECYWRRYAEFLRYHPNRKD